MPREREKEEWLVFFCQHPPPGSKHPSASAGNYLSIINATYERVLDRRRSRDVAVRKRKRKRQKEKRKKGKKKKKKKEVGERDPLLYGI
jgi:hypothetical protein